MNERYHGPAVFPPAAEVRKRVEAHLDSLLSGETKAPPQPPVARKKRFKLRKPRRRP